MADPDNPASTDTEDTDRKPRNRIPVNERHLASLKNAFDAGVEAAAPTALLYCVEHKVTPPDWAIVASCHLLFQFIRGDKARKRGRHGNFLAQYRQDMIDSYRFDVVETVREQQVLQHRALEELLALKYPPAPARMIEEKVRTCKAVGTSLADAMRFAPRQLRGTFAHGSPRTIKASYYRFLRRSRNPKNRGRWYDLGFKAYRLLGMEQVFHAPKGKGTKLEDLFAPISRSWS